MTTPFRASAHERMPRDRRSTANDRKFVVALARGLDVLRAFKATDGVLGNQEIAARTHLPKPTVSRLTYTLTKLGYLTHVDQLGKYQLAPAALALGYTALAHLGLRHIARPFLQELADYAAASVALGSPDRNSVIYVEHCLSSAAVAVRLELGSRIPMATTAIGRALIAVLPDEERRELFERLAWREGSRWPKIQAGIEQAIADVATRGFVVSIGEWQADVNAAAAPLVMPNGSGVFAINCGAPAYRLARERLEADIGPRLLSVVRKIEAIVNGRDDVTRMPFAQRCGNRNEKSGRTDGAAGRSYERRGARSRDSASVR